MPMLAWLDLTGAEYDMYKRKMDFEWCLLTVIVPFVFCFLCLRANRARSDGYVVS